MLVILMKKKGKKDGYLLRSVKEYEGVINVICMSYDGIMIVIVFEDKIGCFWDIKIEECVGLLYGYKSYIISVCVLERYIFISLVDKIVWKWNLESGVCIKIFFGYILNVNCVICLGDLVFLSFYDKIVKCWYVDIGECLWIFCGYWFLVMLLLLVLDLNCGVVFGVDLENNDDIFIFGLVDGIVKSWGMNLNECFVIYKGYGGVVNCLVVDGKGKILFIGLVDLMICFWDFFIGVFIKIF